VILSFNHARGLAQGLGGNQSESGDANPHDEVVRWEVNHASSEKVLAQRERRGYPLDLGPLVRWKRRGR
jgi:hypothetical protein